MQRPSASCTTPSSTPSPCTPRCTCSSTPTTTGRRCCRSTGPATCSAASATRTSLRSAACSTARSPRSSRAWAYARRPRSRTSTRPDALGPAASSGPAQRPPRGRRSAWSSRSWPAAPSSITGPRRCMPTTGSCWRSWPLTAVTPPGNRLTLEGPELIIIEVGHADTDDSSVLHAPDLGLVVAGDVLYNGVHQWLAESGSAGRDAWRTAIDIVAALEPRWAVAGHKNKTLDDDAARAIAETRQYLHDAEELLRETSTAPGFFNAMIERYPEPPRPGRGLEYRPRPIRE